MWSVFINRHSPDAPFRFADLVSLQSEVLHRIRPSGGKALLFAELAPTVTLGARQWVSDPARIEILKAGAVEVVNGERGGNETWHGPGQWVGFVLTPLLDFTGDSKGVRLAVHRMLSHVLPVARQFLPEARIEDGPRLGIWSDRGKLCSIGIRVRDGYTTSGFALNCIPDAAAFSGLDPCGIAGARPDFLFRAIQDPERIEAEFRRMPSLLTASFHEKRTPPFF